MRLSNTVVSVLVVTAVLVFAYGMGLLIRQMRTGGSHNRSATEANDAVAARRTAISPPGPGAAQAKDTPEERTRLKEEKAQAIEKMSSLTEEQKEKFRSQVRKQVGGRRSSKGLQDVAPQQRAAQKIRGQSQSEAGRQKEDVNAPALQGESTNTKPSTDKAGSEPGKAGPG
jgi:hypothetical protein